nr:hypothetical protein [Tanacetum cinerariifolium]
EEIDIVTETDDVLPPIVENDNDLSNDPLLEEAYLFLASDNLIPPGIENVANDSEGDIRFLKELLIDDSILYHESSDSNFEDNPSFPCLHRNRQMMKLMQEKRFQVIRKSSISLNNTSQISSIHAIAPIISTEEPEHSLSMGYEHLSITPETKSDEVTESNAKNLLPIPSECEVTSEDESKCDIPIQDQSSLAFTTFLNPLFNNDDLDSSNDESLPDEDVPAEEFKIYSNPLFDEDEINSDK